ARFGAQVFALMTFATEWNADTADEIVNLATANHFDVTDPEQARAVCEEFDLNPVAMGDHAPKITFAGTGAPGYQTEKHAHVETLIRARHDAMTRGDTEAANVATYQLVNGLMSY